MIFLIVPVLILLIFYLNQKKENFRIFWNPSPSTRNMSYDLRCEPKIPKKDYYFRSSSIQPFIRPKCLKSF